MPSTLLEEDAPAPSRRSVGRRVSLQAPTPTRRELGAQTGSGSPHPHPAGQLASEERPAQNAVVTAGLPVPSTGSFCPLGWGLAQNAEQEYTSSHIPATPWPTTRTHAQWPTLDRLSGCLASETREGPAWGGPARPAHLPRGGPAAGPLSRPSSPGLAQGPRGAATGLQVWGGLPGQ